MVYLFLLTILSRDFSHLSLALYCCIFFPAMPFEASSVLNKISVDSRQQPRRRQPLSRCLQLKLYRAYQCHHSMSNWVGRLSNAIRYDTIRDAILTCARKLTWVGLIYRTEPTTKKCKNRKTKSRKQICSEITRAYSKRVPRTNYALQIKKCASRISYGIYFLSTS